MVAIYNDPINGQQSSVGIQQNTKYWQKKSLIEVAKEQYFGQLADSVSMPKHMGKKLTKYHYLPILDDANINDQGIDANGVSTTLTKTIKIVPAGVVEASNGMNVYWATGEGADAAAALVNAKADAVDIFKNLGLFNTDYATTKTAIEALDPAWTVDESAPAVPNTGNLYGSSKDVGSILAKMPALGEEGGYVNQVGMTRVQIEGTFEKFGFYRTYTKESIDFDSDAELEGHIHSEMTKAANEMTEDAIQIDLLNAAGVIRYGGAASSKSTVSGETGAVTQITYGDLMRLGIDLDNNRCPKKTKLIAGSRMTDTKTIDSARYMYIGSELIPVIRAMKDLHNNPAFVPVHQYASAGNVARGEIGSIDQWRFIVVPEMMHWAGAGASVSNNDGYRESAGKYNVYPMLAVGSGAFTTIGFQSSGDDVKFKIKHSKPESPESYAQDPYGEKGFMSIKWYYGSMILRPEWIALCLTVAPY